MLRWTLPVLLGVFVNSTAFGADLPYYKTRRGYAPPPQVYAPTPPPPKAKPPVPPRPASWPRPTAPAPPVEVAHPHVVERGQTPKGAHELKGPPDPAGADAMGWQPGDVAAPEADAAPVRPQQAPVTHVDLELGRTGLDRAAIVHMGAGAAGR